MTESPIVNEWMELAANESRLQEARDVLLLALRKRFPGALPQEMLQLIKDQPSRDVLHDWFGKALESADVAEFYAYLRR